MSKLNVAARRRARRFVLQAIYQWHFNPESPAQLVEQFLAQAEIVSADVEFFKALLMGVIMEQAQLDQLMKPFLEQSSFSVQPVELAILRMGLYEIKYIQETPYRVIINEAVELAKAFGASGAHKYVNGVLHGLAAQYRVGQLHESSLA